MKLKNWIYVTLIIALGGSLFNIEWVTYLGIFVSVFLALIPFVKLYIHKK